MPTTLSFTQVPDESGNGTYQVTAANLPGTTLVALYGYSSENSGQASLLPGYTAELTSNSPSCTWESEGTPTEAFLCAGFDAATVSSAPPTLNLAALSSISGFIAIAIGMPSCPAAESQAIVQAGIEFAESIENGTVKCDPGTIPTLAQAVQQLTELGVPAAYFTPDVETNLQALLNSLQVNAEGKITPVEGVFGCIACKIGIGVAIAALVIGVAVAIVAATGGGAAAIIAAVQPVLAASTIGAVAANAAVLAPAIAGGIWAGGVAEICTLLIVFLPTEICEATGAC